MEGRDSNKREDIFSKPVRAGKRTYFFDVKATRGDDYYLTITESKRRIDNNGKFSYDKHKLFLYKEDFEKFAEGMEEALAFIRNAKGDDYGIDESQYTAAPAFPVAETSLTASEEPEPEATAAAPELTPEPTPTSNNNYSSDISFDDLEDDDKS
jgi:hypothetical protein